MLTAVYNTNVTMNDAVNACSVQPVALERGGAPVAVVLPYDVYENLYEMADELRIIREVEEIRRENKYLSGPELMESLKKRLAEIDAMEAAENESSTGN